MRKLFLFYYHGGAVTILLACWKAMNVEKKCWRDACLDNCTSVWGKMKGKLSAWKMWEGLTGRDIWTGYCTCFCRCKDREEQSSPCSSPPPHPRPHVWMMVSCQDLVTWSRFHMMPNFCFQAYPCVAEVIKLHHKLSDICFYDPFSI